MPCRWEASERPLLVRTVWIRGIRHALLTREELAKGGRTRLSSAKTENSKRNAEDVAERVCRWLAASRPLTPYGGSLWETPRSQILDVRSSKASLSPKTPGPGPTCSPMDLRQPEHPESSSPPVEPTTPPVIRHFELASTKSASSRRSVSFQSTSRPKLHIFMPDTRPTQQEIKGETAEMDDTTSSYLQFKGYFAKENEICF